MKIFIRLFVIGGLSLSGCNEDPIIQTDGFGTKPVIFCVIESFDTLHDIRLGRYFSGITNPKLTAQIADSIYFASASVSITLFDRRGKKFHFPVEKVVETDKEPGLFNSDDYGVYRFREPLVLGEYPNYFLPYEKFLLEVTVPGLPVAKCSTALIWPPKIWWPIQAAQFIYIYPDNPMRVLWSGDAWNEIDVAFNIMEQFEDSTVVKTFTIQKTNDIHWNGKYYEIKVPYEYIVQILEQNLKVRHDIIRRYFGSFRIDILTGNQDFDTFMRFRDGINDFNYNPFFNVENGIGMLAAKCGTTKMALYLDQASRLKFAGEPSLKKFNFIEY
jgi:hypothetical protein